MATLTIYYIRADWCGPCLQLDPYILPDESGNAGDIVNAFGQAWQQGIIDWKLVDITTQDDLDYAEDIWGPLSAPRLIFEKNGQVIDEIIGYLDPELIFDRIKNQHSITPDPLPDEGLIIFTNSGGGTDKNYWWLLFLAGAAYYVKQQQA